MAEKDTRTLHMIGHGHIDPVWLWRWQEGFEEVRGTFRSALDRMNETPGFKFTASSAAFYKWVRDNEPEMFEQIRRRVKEGRWEIAGGWWIEPDCNVPHGESLVRQGLYAQRFFQKEFGRKAVVGFNPDSFGHAGTFPQILSKMGLEFYCYMRPSPEQEFHYPGRNGTTFNWQSPDGSEVIASLIPDSYGAWGEIKPKVDAVLKWPFLMDGQKHIMCVYGVGNHGGGPTKKAIAGILELQKSKSGPKLVFSRLEEYFRAMEKAECKKLTTIKTELQHHARGCYSAQSEIKRLNRKCEHALMSAERFAAAVSQAFGTEYPAERFERAWTNVLFNQFHDVLAGTCVKEAYEDVRDSFGEARQIASDAMNSAVTAIARRMDTTAEGNCVLAVNPLPWPVRTAIKVTPRTWKHIAFPLRMLDAKGKPVPTQSVLYGFVENEASIFWAEIPAMGVRLYRAVGAKDAPEYTPRGKLEISSGHIENDFWRVEIDASSGEISRLYDKKNKAEVLTRGGILASVVDHSDTWSHDISEYRIEDGRFGSPRIQVFENGEVRATLRITTTLGKSTIDHYITLYRMSDKIECKLDINWQEHMRVLKLGFQTKLKETRVFAEAPYGVTERAAKREEEPCQSWVDLGGKLDGKDYGFALLNDSKYAYDARGGELRLTVLRSPAYALHDPARYDSSKPYPIMDQGQQTVCYEIVPHAGSWADAGVPRRAWELNEPAFSHVESGHKGKVRPEVEFMKVTPENVIASVMKRPEKGEGLVIRLYEAHGKDCKADIALPFFGRKVRVGMKAHEIKTIRVRPEKGWKMEEVNLLEE